MAHGSESSDTCSSHTSTHSSCWQIRPGLPDEATNSPPEAGGVEPTAATGTEEQPATSPCGDFQRHWDEGYRRFRGPVVAGLRMYGVPAFEAEDVAQDTALQLRLSAERAGTVSLLTNASVWHHQAWLQWLQRYRLRQRQCCESLTDDEDGDADPEQVDVVTLIGLRGFIDRLFSLSPQYAAILRIAAGLATDAEIAMAFDVTESTVRGWRYLLRREFALDFAALVAH